MKSLVHTLHVGLWHMKRALLKGLARTAGSVRSGVRACALRGGVAVLRTRGQGRLPGPTVLRWLEYGWDNGGWPASPEYLQETARLAAATPGTVVEAGSGLSSIVLSYVVRADQPIVSFEHHRQWADRVARYVSRRGSYRVLTRPLTPREGYDWYAVEPSDLPAGITLAVIDGPPGSTRGGRYGALPELAEHLAPGAILLLDDTARPQEQQAMDRWAAEYGTTSEVRETGDKPFAIIRLPDA